MTVWFVSDLHLGDKNIIKYCSRPFSNCISAPSSADAHAMDDALVANWNAVVGFEDDVYDIGDLASTCSYDYALYRLQQLKGRHHFVKGNHDDLAEEIYLKEPRIFASFNRGYKEIAVEGQTIVLCHYAMREWHHALRGVWHLFGHTHALLEPFGKSVDVGVDNCGAVAPGAFFRPLSFDEIAAYMAKRPIGAHPGFADFTARSR
jgi:calcineurin-like phosphoesterase family protein